MLKLNTSELEDHLSELIERFKEDILTRYNSEEFIPAYCFEDEDFDQEEYVLDKYLNTENIPEDFVDEYCEETWLVEYIEHIEEEFNNRIFKIQ